MSNTSWKEEFKAYASLQDAASAEKIKKAILHGKETEKRPEKRAFKWKTAILAAALLLLASGTVLAVAALRHPDHETEQYLNTVPESREEIPEISKALEGTKARVEAFSVELLGEYRGGYNPTEESFNTKIPLQRIENGFPAWDPDAYAFLRDMTPGACEVYYDGSRLYINNCIRTASATSFLKIWGYDFGQEHNLDMNLMDCTAEVNGKDCTQTIHGGWGTGTMMTLQGKKEAELKDTNELWVSTDFDCLTSPLEDGVCRIALQYYINDADIDDMGSIGNVARVICTVAFDTREGNRGQTVSSVTEMSGNMILTVFGYSREKQCSLVGNRTVSLSGMTLSAQTQYTASGAIVEIKAASLPQGWDDDMLRSFFNQMDSGISFDLYVNGGLVKTVHLSSSGRECRMELPVLPSDYADITDIRLVPHLGYLKYVDLCSEVQNSEDFETEKYEKRELILNAEPLEGHFMWETEDTVSQDMPGCEIILPLPKIR